MVSILTYKNFDYAFNERRLMVLCHSEKNRNIVNAMGKMASCAVLPLSPVFHVLYFILISLWLCFLYFFFVKFSFFHIFFSNFPLSFSMFFLFCLIFLLFAYYVGSFYHFALKFSFTDYIVLSYHFSIYFFISVFHYFNISYMILCSFFLVPPLIFRRFTYILTLSYLFNFFVIIFFLF